MRRSKGIKGRGDNRSTEGQDSRPNPATPAVTLQPNGPDTAWKIVTVTLDDNETVPPVCSGEKIHFKHKNTERKPWERYSVLHWPR